MARLLDDGALEASSVVANRTMNRERPLTGRGGYGRELGIDVMRELTTRVGRPGNGPEMVGGVSGGGADGSAPPPPPAEPDSSVPPTEPADSPPPPLPTEPADSPPPAELHGSARPTEPTDSPPRSASGAGAGRTVRWLDLCCGSGRAPAEAASLLARRELGHRVEIVGLDLVGHFAVPADPPAFRLVVASVTDWVPDGRFDLITCVHGLHYVGDKLGTLARIASWLTEDGLFVANLDARSVRFAEEPPARRGPSAELRRQGFAYDAARRRVSRLGAGGVRFPCRYLGADDQAGPNYTGQPAVDSFYQVADETG
jgi:SAM-dependent methyltransferase